MPTGACSNSPARVADCSSAMARSRSCPVRSPSRSRFDPLALGDLGFQPRLLVDRLAGTPLGFLPGDPLQLGQHDDDQARDTVEHQAQDPVPVPQAEREPGRDEEKVRQQRPMMSDSGPVPPRRPRSERQRRRYRR